LFERREGHRLTVAAYCEHRGLACALCLPLIEPGTSEQDVAR
jgi:hypothetical protein